MKTMLEMIVESGKHPELPEELDPAVKFVSPDWTTHGGGFNWFHGVGWVESDTPFNPKTCVEGGLHVARTFQSAQSGGAKPAHALWVGVDPDESGPWEGDKRKAPKVFVAGPIDLIRIIRTHGHRTNLSGAYLNGADLYGANLTRALLTKANLTGALLTGAQLYGVDLTGAKLGGAKLYRAYGRDDWDDLVARGAIR